MVVKPPGTLGQITSAALYTGTKLWRADRTHASETEVNRGKKSKDLRSRTALQTGRSQERIKRLGYSRYSRVRRTAIERSEAEDAEALVRSTVAKNGACSKVQVEGPICSERQSKSPSNLATPMKTVELNPRMLMREGSRCMASLGFAAGQKLGIPHTASCRSSDRTGVLKQFSASSRWNCLMSSETQWH